MILQCLNAGSWNISSFCVRVEQLHGTSILKTFVDILITNTFFQGEEYRSPIYNSDTAASGLMKLVGTIIVHSILQGGPGLPVFSPGIYYYLAKGNAEEAMENLTVIDCSLEMRDFISKVINNLQYEHDIFCFPNKTVEQIPHKDIQCRSCGL